MDRTYLEESVCLPGHLLAEYSRSLHNFIRGIVGNNEGEQERLVSLVPAIVVRGKLIRLRLLLVIR